MSQKDIEYFKQKYPYLIPGYKVNMLTVISEIYRYNDKVIIDVKCECGESRSIAISLLIRSERKQISCGCERLNNLIKRSTSHGLCGTKLYSIYNGMKDRCSNINNSKYAIYGGKGIKVCEEWSNDFKKFY